MSVGAKKPADKFDCGIEGITRTNRGFYFFTIDFGAVLGPITQMSDLVVREK